MYYVDYYTNRNYIDRSVVISFVLGFNLGNVCNIYLILMSRY